MFDVLIILTNMLIPLVLVLGWLFAEFRCRIPARLILGFTCLLYMSCQIWLTATVANQHLTLHAITLNLMERRLDEGQEPQVRRALQAYQKEYGETYDAKEAVVRMMAVLRE